MAQLIDKDALVAEIKKRKKEWQYGSSTEAKYKKEECDDILSFIEALEVKEANSVWHDAIELPDETSLILLSLKDGNFILADEKTAYIRELVDKWCYVSDI